ncbi:hypothetical protein GGR56DRAFT_668240 [Xylariaceae sp. FL0804]|nr:hypothetical protein GGR56DRAFT_668240 [Xylariaceae sp. FL0804]
MWLLYTLLTTWLAYAGLASAQSASASASQMTELISALPKCALPCLLDAVQASPCGTTDIACQCQDPELTKSAQGCIVANCTIVEALCTTPFLQWLPPANMLTRVLAAKNLTQTACGAPVRNMTTEYVVISIVMFAAAALVVLARVLYAQFFRDTGLGLDDVFVIATLILCVPSIWLNISVLAGNGLGRDTWTLTPEQITRFAQGFYINTIMYFFCLFVGKLALLFFYLRIFPGITIRRLLWGTVAFDVLFGVAFIVTAVFQCWPISDNWNNWKGEGVGHCADASVIAWANAVVSIALDVWMLALPISQLGKLNLRWKKKLMVGLMFCVGTFVTVVSCLRLANIVKFRASSNLTWDYWDVCLWSTVEIGVGIICTCMPTLRQMLSRRVPKVLDGTTRRDGGHGSSKRSPDKSHVSSMDSSVNRRSLPHALIRPAAALKRLSRGPGPASPISVSQSITIDGVHFSNAEPPLWYDPQGEDVQLVPLDPISYPYGTSVAISGGWPLRDSCGCTPAGNTV